MNDRKSKLNSMSCRRCGRALKDSESIKRGIGPICLEKELQETPKIGNYDITKFHEIWDHIYERETESSRQEKNKEIIRWIMN